MKIGKGTLPSKIIQKMWILDKHAHLKKVNMQEINFQQKPQITRGLQILIWEKNAIFAKYIKCKDSQVKWEYHLKYSQVGVKNSQKLQSLLLHLSHSF